MADETKLTAATRIEKLLDNIAGGDNEVTPATRLEKFLSYIADAMEGSGDSGGSALVVVDCPYVDDGEREGYFSTLTVSEIAQIAQTAKITFHCILEGGIYTRADAYCDLVYITYENTYNLKYRTTTQSSSSGETNAKDVQMINVSGSVYPEIKPYFG